jgi:ribosomal protein S19E (S16A)
MTMTDRREKALTAISIAGSSGLSAFAIGSAAVRGERPDQPLTNDAKREIGREVAEALMRDGLVRLTADRYVLSQWVRRQPLK